MEQKSKKIDIKIIIIVIVVIIAIVEGIFIFASNKGTNAMTIEEMLEIAQDHTGETISFFRRLEDNKALAETQKNKIFKIDGEISEIEKDYCTFFDGQSPSIQIKIYLEQDILVNLKKGQSITIVGTLSNITTEPKGMTYFCIFEIKDCYLLEG